MVEAEERIQHLKSKAKANGIYRRISDQFSNTNIRTVYDFKELLGSGSFGDVRVGHLKVDPTQTDAIKSVHRKRIDDEDVRFLEEELAVMQQLDHPNIVKFRQCFIDNNYIHIVMEHIKGVSVLKHWETTKNLTEGNAATIMRKMMLAVQHLHDKGIVHRDLKPENFVMDMGQPGSTPEVKLIDFGYAKRFIKNIQRADSGEPDFDSSTPMLMRIESEVGTPEYVAPDLLNACASEDDYDKSVDVWSLGVILYFLLCGDLPFYGANDHELFTAIKEQELEFDETVWGAISRAGRDLV